MLRAIYRTVCLILTCVIFTFVGIALKLLFLRNEKKRRHYITVFTRRWARCFCFFFNIRVKVVGNCKPSPNALIVSNHVGSPDIFVLGSCFETFFVSKEDVGAWPLVGCLASLGATIFVDRTKRSQVPATISEIQGRLEEGFSVTVFPEGRATDGSDVIAFKSPHFQAAALAGCPVLPIMIRYLDSHQPSIACWYNMSFFSHMLALLKNTRLEVIVHILPEIAWKDNRRFLANESHRLIREAHQKSERD